MGNVKKFNISHGLSVGSGSNPKDVVDSSGKVVDVGTLSTLKTSNKTDVVNAINSLYDYVESVDYRQETSEPTGIQDRSASAIFFDSSTKLFSIYPAPGQSEFVVWTKGTKRTFTNARTVSIGSNPSSGLYYIYFDPEGVLRSKTTYFDWENDTMVAYVYWNASTESAPFIADERHGIVLDWQTHEYLHRTRGAVLANGFSAGNFLTTGDGSTDFDAQFDLSGGTFFDEDLEVIITHSDTPTSGTWDQDLQGPAKIPVFYLSGNEWVLDNPTDFATKQGTSRVKYNQLSGGSWSASDVPTDGWYTTSWVLATNNINYPIIAVMGQSSSPLLSDEEARTFSDLSLPGFPVVEFRPLWKVVWQTNSSYSNSIKARIAGVYDIRQLSPASTSGIVQADHGLLTGLSDDDHPQYVHTSVNRTITASHNITGNLRLSGGLRDGLNSFGAPGQLLTSTGSGVQWKYLTQITNVLFVTKDGNDSNSGASLQDSKLTIKAALQIASAGTVIKVSAGSYTENNPLVVPKQVSVVGDSLREVSVTPQNSGDLFYVGNGSYVSNMSFTSPTSNSGAIFSFDPANPPYIDQSPYIQNCTNFVPNSIGLKVDGDNCLGQLKSMVVDSYTQYNSNGIGAKISNEGYAQLVSMFTICCDKAIECSNGGGCDLTNSNSSMGNYGLVAQGVSDLKYTGTISGASAAGSNTIDVSISSPIRNISSAIYNNTTGLLTVTTSTAHGFQIGMDVEVQNLTFNCTSGGSTSSQTFPSGAYGYVFSVYSVPSSTQFSVRVGTSTITHTYVSGGTARVKTTRPFDGQVLYLNQLYYTVNTYNITGGGGGYTSVPKVTVDPPSESWGIRAEAIAQLTDGVVTSIQVVSSGRGYSSTPPSVTIDPPPSGGTQAYATAGLSPTYFLVQESTEISSGNYRVTLNEPIPIPSSVSDTVYFYKQSRLLASGHSFEYIGSGTNINTSLPRNGGQPIQENEVRSLDGGLVIYTSTDHSGNFRIGDGVVIDQATGFISGDAYSKSLFSAVTPFILALGT